MYASLPGGVLNNVKYVAQHIIIMTILAFSLYFCIVKVNKLLIMKLYLIKWSSADMFVEQAITAVRNLPKNTQYYKYEVLEECNVRLPRGYSLCRIKRIKGYSKEIFFGDEYADMVTVFKDKHYVTSLVTSDCDVVLKKWNF